WVGRCETASGPDRFVRITLLEFDPHPRTDRRHEVRSHRGAGGPGERDAGFTPARRHESEHIGDFAHDPAAQFGVDIQYQRSAVLAVKALERVAGLVHTGTLGVREMRPSRLSSKPCLYSPRLISWVTLFT